MDATPCCSCSCSACYSSLPPLPIATKNEEVLQFVISRTEFTTKMTRIQFFQQKIGDDGLQFMLQTLQTNAPNLTELSLQCNGVRGGGFTGSFLSKNRTLKVLSFCDNGLGDQGVGTLTEGLKRNNTLKTLLLYYNEITFVGVEKILENLQFNYKLSRLLLRAAINETNWFSQGLHGKVMTFFSKTERDARRRQSWLTISLR